MADSDLLRSPVHAKHLDAGAVMCARDGWEVPLHYGQSKDEALAARESAAIFDLSHFGRLRIRGDGALSLLEQVCPGDVAHQEDDTAVATSLLTAEPNAATNCHLVRLADFWVLLTPPHLRTSLLDQLSPLAEQANAQVDDQTLKTVLFVVSGPAAAARLDPILPEPVSGLAPLAVRSGSFMIARYIAARIDYTGQWCLAVILPNILAGQAWRFITEKAGENRISPAGLAAFDTLREKG